MADTHGQQHEPQAAPMHSEVKERFSPLQVTIAVSLGLTAIIAGIVTGLVFVNS